MRIEFTAEQALANARRNPERGWARSSPGRSARERLLAGGLLDIAHRPKFALDPTWPVFTMGSCFAREIERVLIARDIPVVTAGHGVPCRHYAAWADGSMFGQSCEGDEIHPGALNKYTVLSMLHEIRAALTEQTFPDDGLIELRAGEWFDPNSAGLRHLEFETASAN